MIKRLVLLSVFFRVIYTNAKGVLNVTFYILFIRKATKKPLCNLHTFRMCSLPSRRPDMMLIMWMLLKKEQHCLFRKWEDFLCILGASHGWEHAVHAHNHYHACAWSLDFPLKSFFFIKLTDTLALPVTDEITIKQARPVSTYLASCQP